MNVTPLLDPGSAALVIIGTVLATLMRCGWSESRSALWALAQLFKRRFDAGQARAELAVQVQAIAADGLIRAEPRRFGDDEFDAMTDELIRTRSIEALHGRHMEHRIRRIETARSATAVFNSAAELAPVLGLVGTLLSLGTLATAVAADGDYARAIGMAVATTLYGLVIANFVFAPLAATTSRRAEAEDRAREDLLDWLLAGLEESCSRPASQIQAAA